MKPSSARSGAWAQANGVQSSVAHFRCVLAPRSRRHVARQSGEQQSGYALDRVPRRGREANADSAEPLCTSAKGCCTLARGQIRPSRKGRRSTRECRRDVERWRGSFRRAGGNRYPNERGTREDRGGRRAGLIRAVSPGSRRRNEPDFPKPPGTCSATLSPPG